MVGGIADGERLRRGLWQGKAAAMRDVIIRARESVFGALAAVLWAGWLPLGMRSALLRALMAREPRTGGSSRQLGMLASAVARAGARALVRLPRQTGEMIRRAETAGARPVLIAGDSHSRLYVHRSRRDGAWLLPLHHLATAASARGLGRTDSRSGQGEALMRVVAGAREAELAFPVLLVFGQVDAEFVYMFKRLASDPPAPHDDGAYRAFAAETAEAYAAFAARLPVTGSVHLATIFPPALSDAAWRSGYVNAHVAGDHAGASVEQVRARLGRAEISPLAARTRDHAVFNVALAEAAQRAGLQMLDTVGALPMKNGALDAALLGQAAGTDHHLDGEALRPYMTPLLWRVAT